IFIRRAGTVILGISILLWFLATYPKDRALEESFRAQRQAVEQTSAKTTADLDKVRKTRLAEIDRAEAGAQLRHSYAGRLGHFIEPVIRPLGFDWQMGIGIVSSFAAREVFVST